LQKARKFRRGKKKKTDNQTFIACAIKRYNVVECEGIMGMNPTYKLKNSLNLTTN
jgi:hypothetical protein